ncbi:MAG: DNA-processing protein DprA [Acidobacteriota bacterium]|jgi:DNA processing protein
METILDRLTLALLPGLGPRGRSRLLTRPLADVLARPDDHPDLLPRLAREALRGGRARQQAEAARRRASEEGLRVVGSDEPDYPPWLARTCDPPPVLFVRGTLMKDEGERAVALVGSRAATTQGLTFARALGRGLAEAGVTVVSGLARGIDAAAHRGALEADGRTVAVLGSGHGRLYPRENEDLARAIAARRGAVVSEFPVDTRPWKGNFPRRNRVIAGWGRAVVVVEAGERSGALITARLALEEGRDVLAVPGHPTWPGAAGTNALLRDGAVIVRHAGDILEEIGLGTPSPAELRTDDDVLAALRQDAPSSVEEIAARCDRELPELLSRLGELELAARVRRLPGPLFVRS